jgi:hypothetical protein
VATAIANADARTEVTASRARIVAASDAARRRFERDLHDGAQQRLVSLGLQLRTAEALLPPGFRPLREQLSDVVAGLTGVSEDLQEISRGIHPAILSRGGLGPALKTLARRSAVPVELHLGIDRRLPESAEVAAYYVVAEALTNAAKYARASEVRVSIEAAGTNLSLSITDDGIGGADSRKGSGLIGFDRPGRGARGKAADRQRRGERHVTTGDNPLRGILTIRPRRRPIPVNGTALMGAGGDDMALRASNPGIARYRNAGISMADTPANTKVRLCE